MATSRMWLRSATSTRRRRSLWGWLLPPAFLLAGSVGGTLLALLPDASLTQVLHPAAVERYAAPLRGFAVCAGTARTDCVVDGDTFWLAGTRVRIADINTPEVSSPGCVAEAALGRRATTRLLELLNAGPFELVSIDRDEDVYGRKLRIVTRNGTSIGDALVAEGLAHAWRGYQENWC